MSVIDQILNSSGLPSSSDASEQSTHAAAPEAYLTGANPVVLIFVVIVILVGIVTLLHWAERFKTEGK